MLKTRSRSLNTTMGRQRMRKSRSINHHIHHIDKSTDKNRRSYRELRKRQRQDGQKKNDSKNFMKSKFIAEMIFHELHRANKQNRGENNMKQFNNQKFNQKDNKSIYQKNPQKIIPIPTASNQQNLQEFSDKYLKIKEYQPIPLNRARMIDWLLEVCSAFGLRWQVFWGAVQLLDILIQQFNYVKCSNIHIVGITCLFISEKFFSYIPLHIDQIIQKALHNAYSTQKMLKQQQKIIKKLTQSKKPLSFYTTIYTLYINHIIHASSKQNHCIKFTQPQKIELMRQLIIIWMDPLQCFGGEFAKQMPKISYQGVFWGAVRKIGGGRYFGEIQRVGRLYQEKYKCLNVNDYRVLGKIVF